MGYFNGPFSKINTAILLDKYIKIAEYMKDKIERRLKAIEDWKTSYLTEFENWKTSHLAEFDAIKEQVENSTVLPPLILNADNTDQYGIETVWGDAALEAIIDGRQILIRVPNANGELFTSIYSPIYMYQLPRFENDYLYLFYLRDEKQDLSAVVPGLLLPTYGELAMKLSKTYTKCPLEENEKQVYRTTVIYPSQYYSCNNLKATIIEGEQYQVTFYGINLTWRDLNNTQVSLTYGGTTSKFSFGTNTHGYVGHRGEIEYFKSPTTSSQQWFQLMTRGSFGHITGDLTIELSLNK